MEQFDEGACFPRFVRECARVSARRATTPLSTGSAGEMSGGRGPTWSSVCECTLRQSTKLANYQIRYEGLCLVVET